MRTSRGGVEAPDSTTALAGIKSKTRIADLFRNIKAFCKGCCTIGMLVNNCVTDNANLPLAASQGKYLMDQILSLNGRIFPYNGEFSGDFNESNNILPGVYRIDSSNTYRNGPDTKPSYCNFIQFQGYSAQMIIDRSIMYIRKYAGSPPTWETWTIFKSLKWQELKLLVLTETNQEVRYDRDNIDEILVSYGNVNGEQIYGGGTICFAKQEDKVCFLPVYVNDFLNGVVYIYNNFNGSKIVARVQNNTQSVQIRIWVR